MVRKLSIEISQRKPARKHAPAVDAGTPLTTSASHAALPTSYPRMAASGSASAASVMVAGRDLRRRRCVSSGERSTGPEDTTGPMDRQRNAPVNRCPVGRWTDNATLPLTGVRSVCAALTHLLQGGSDRRAKMRCLSFGPLSAPFGPPSAHHGRTGRAGWPEGTVRNSSVPSS